jgi:DNA topoisomerase-1
MQTVLVESPTKARKLSQFLGKEFSVEASMGHVRDLPKSKLGIDVEHDFAPEYVVDDDKKSTVAKLKKLVAKSDKVYLATDPDREGEAIAWHLQFLLDDPAAKKKKIEFVRSTFHEITKDAVAHAIEHPTTININLVDAQQARRVLDRLVGYSLSPVLWKKVRRGLSAGRVQSVALRLIVEREKEISAFKADEYWEVDALVAYKAQEFAARVVKIGEKDYAPTKKDDVEDVVADLKKASYTVSSVERTQRKRSSLPPFTTSTLQQAAANRLGWSAKQTMRVAQELYEEGLITYHRTDSVNLSSQAIDAARDYISKSFGKNYLPDSARIFKVTSKNAQEAHEAIRPTNVSIEIPADSGAKEMEEKHAKLYGLIWRRFVASQMQTAVYDQTTILIDAKGRKTYGLRTAGSILTFDGWMKLFPNREDVTLPNVEKGNSLDLHDVTAAQKFTQPPPRYNDASLVKTLEKLGIGRPSTYASIISVIMDRGYVERVERAFVPSVVGITVADFLVKYFPTEMDYQFTAGMEDDLDAIARGEKVWTAVLKTFYGPFDKNVKEVTKDAERSQVPVEKLGKKCPDCGIGELVIRTGRFGKFISCSRFPECKHTEKFLDKVEGMKCPDCKIGDVVLKRTKRGRPFYGCSRYPDCKFASWKKPGSENAALVDTTQSTKEADAETADPSQTANEPAAVTTK